MSKVLSILKDLGEAVVMTIALIIVMALLLIVAIPVGLVLGVGEIISYIRGQRHGDGKEDCRGDLRDEATAEDYASDSDEH